MNKFRTTVLACIVCLTALYGGLSNHKSRQVNADLPGEQPEWLKQFPSYANVMDGAPASLADDMMVNGLPFKAAYIRTDDPINKVVNFYMGVWTSQGRDPKQGVNGESITIMIDGDDDKAMKNLLVSVADKGEYREIMLTENTTMWNGMFKKEQPESVLFNPPLPEGAVAFLNSENITANLGSATKLYSIPKSVAECQSFYYGVMTQMGFHEHGRSSEEDNDIIYFEAGKMFVSITFIELSVAPPVTAVTFNYLEQP